MSLSTTITYDVAGNFTFDTDLIEITGGLARLKDQRPADATFHAPFSVDIDGLWGDGVLTGTATGGASVSGGYLDLTGGTGQYVDFAGADNADPLVQTGCIRCTYQPGYSGSPAANQSVIPCPFKTIGLVNNSVLVLHLTNGQLLVRIYEDSASAIINTSMGAFSPTAGTDYEIELNFDVTTGETRLFVAGTQFGSTLTQTGTRSASINTLRVGDFYGGTGSPDHKVKDVILYSTVQHTADYTPGQAIPTLYSTANPDIVVKSGFEADALSAFASVSSASGSDAVKFALEIDGTDQYWDGAQWTTSTGYSQTNTAADINSNAAALDIATGATVKVRGYLHSDDGSTRPTLTSATVTYDFFITEPAAPDECIVYDWVVDQKGEPIAGASIVWSHAGFYHGNHYIAATREALRTDSDGYWEITVVESASVSLSPYQVDLSLPGTITSKKWTGLQVPDSATESFSNIV